MRKADRRALGLEAGLLLSWVCEVAQPARQNSLSMVRQTALRPPEPLISMPRAHRVVLS